jgi:formylglycine-generating enzyme
MMVSSGTIERSIATQDSMVRIPGGTFRMGSDKHYPEEAPAR